MLNTEIKTSWITELRSGHYKQGPARLHRVEDDTYCCLGVLCKSQGLQETAGRFQFLKDGNVVANRIASLDDSYLEVIGLDKKHMVHLMMMNDEDGKTFAEISDYIESNL